MKKRILNTLSTYSLVIIGMIFVFPLIITLAGSFMSEKEIFLNYTTTPSTFDLLEGMSTKFKEMNLVPSKATFSGYEQALFKQPAFLILIGNSLKLALPITIGNVIVSTLSAYGFTVWKFKYKEIIFSIYIIVMLLPLQATLVPNYIIANILGINKSYLAIILPGIFAPFGTFLIRQSLKQVPTSYFEAAAIDGAGVFRTFFYIIMPQIRSIITALVMLVFVESWNIVEQAIIFISDYTKEPLSVYLSRIADNRMGLIFVASVIYMLIPLWLLYIGQKQLEQGIGFSGVK